jgi:hypothetical protein
MKAADGGIRCGSAANRAAAASGDRRRKKGPQVGQCWAKRLHCVKGKMGRRERREKGKRPTMAGTKQGVGLESRINIIGCRKTFSNFKSRFWV